VTAPKGKHPAHGELYTPFTPELLQLLERMKAEYGTWRRVCELTETRMRVLRNIRQGKRKAVSLTVLDRLCSATGIGNAEEFLWFTADDLVALGIWKPPLILNGEWAHKGDEVMKHGKKKIRVSRVKRERAAALKKVNARRRRYGLPPITRRRGGPFS
jgi:DNA-binding Xre family transcriptional regulator